MFKSVENISEVKLKIYYAAPPVRVVLESSKGLDGMLIGVPPDKVCTFGCLHGAHVLCSHAVVTVEDILRFLQMKAFALLALEMVSLVCFSKCRFAFSCAGRFLALLTLRAAGTGNRILLVLQMSVSLWLTGHDQGFQFCI